MRKLLALFAVLALLAVPAVPALAAETTVGGTVPAHTITITPPAALNFGTFTIGLNGPQSSTGSVSVVYVANWTVTTSASNDGFMKDTTPTDLKNRLQVSKDGSAWSWANAALTYGGNPTSLPFYAQQEAAYNDLAGVYSITITFTGNETL